MKTMTAALTAALALAAQSAWATDYARHRGLSLSAPARTEQTWTCTKTLTQGTLTVRGYLVKESRSGEIEIKGEFTAADGRTAAFKDSGKAHPDSASDIYYGNNSTLVVGGYETPSFGSLTLTNSNVIALALEGAATPGTSVTEIRFDDLSCERPNVSPRSSPAASSTRRGASSSTLSPSPSTSSAGWGRARSPWSSARATSASAAATASSTARPTGRSSAFTARIARSFVPSASSGPSSSSRCRSRRRSKPSPSKSSMARRRSRQRRSTRRSRLDGHLAAGMEAGMTDGYARLDELVASLLGGAAAEAARLA